MSTADTHRQTAAVDDMNGRHLAVCQNAGHVRIEIGEAPHRSYLYLPIDAARVIINGLADAVTDARLWQLEHTAAADTAAELEELEQIREYRRP